MRAKDALALLLSAAGTLLALLPFLWMLGDVVRQGLPVLLQMGPRFLTALPPLPGQGLGGVGPSLQGTLFMSGLALALAGGLGLATGVYVALYPHSRLSRLSRALAEAMVEFPTIVIGIVVYLLLVVPTRTFSALAGAVALSLVMLPYVVVQVSEALRAPRQSLLEAAEALGLRLRHTIRVLLGAAAGGVLTAFLIGLAKAIGETAPLLFTTATSFNLYLTSPLSPTSGLPVLIFFFALSPYDNWHQVAWGASFVLALLVLLIFMGTRAARWLGSR